MNRSRLVILLTAIVFSFSLTACDTENIVSSSSLSGNYNMTRMIDKTTGAIYTSGVPLEYLGVTMTISGTLSLTDSSISKATTTISDYFGNPETEKITEQGTYSVIGNMVFVTGFEGNSNSMTFSHNGHELILEDEFSKKVFTRH